MKNEHLFWIIFSDKKKFCCKINKFLLIYLENK